MTASQYRAGVSQSANRAELYDLPDTNGSNGGVKAQEFVCLYTKHKTQKRRIWHDGRLVLLSTRAVLHEANPAPGSSNSALDECEVSSQHRQALLSQCETRLETDKYLIQVEGPWVPPNTLTISKTPKLVSASMQRLLTRKFQKPKPHIPPHPNNSSSQNRLHAILGKRKRPLQPGELARLHHGVSTSNHQSNQQVSREQVKNTIQYPMQNRQSLPQQDQQQYSNQTNHQSHKNSNSLTHRHIETPNAFALQPTDFHNNTSSSTTPQISETSPISSDTSSPRGSVVRQQHKPKPQTEFASNEFNATSFYGLDDEEEEQVQDNYGPQRAPASEKVLNISRSHGNVSSNGENQSENEHSTTRGIIDNESTPQVSGNDLLALFGAMPANNTIDSSTLSLGDEEEQSSRLTTPHSSFPERAGCIQNHDDTTFKFTLPSASESSSEEDSSQEG